MEMKKHTSVRKGKIWIPVSVAVTVLILWAMATGMHTTDFDQTGDKGTDLISRLDMYMANRTSDAMDGVVSVDKVYWLRDEDLVAPVPNPENYGETRDPASLQWLLDDAAKLLDGQETFFNTDIQIKSDSKIVYYLDETIMVITWKEIVGECVFTFSEVKVAHPSQFRRFMAGGAYGSGVLYTTTDMAASVNAVTASSGDYYSYRKYGIVVNDGKVYRSDDGMLDTCFIDDNGDFIMVPKRTLKGEEAVRQFVEENDIRFSVAFGPIMIQDGEVCVPPVYPTGEIEDTYSRACMGQLGPLHYLMVSTNKEPYYVHNPTVKGLARTLLKRGVQTCYNLDGGQTGTIVTRNELINDVDYGAQREISDILYFATALPDEN